MPRNEFVSGRYLFFFESKQTALHIQSAGIAGQALVAAHNTVAGNHNPQGIAVAGHADGAGGSRLSDGGGNLSVGCVSP